MTGWLNLGREAREISEAVILMGPEEGTEKKKLALWLKAISFISVPFVTPKEFYK